MSNLEKIAAVIVFSMGTEACSGAALPQSTLIQNKIETQNDIWAQLKAEGEKAKERHDAAAKEAADQKEKIAQRSACQKDLRSSLPTYWNAIQNVCSHRAPENRDSCFEEKLKIACHDLDEAQKGKK